MNCQKKYDTWRSPTYWVLEVWLAGVGQRRFHRDSADDRFAGEPDLGQGSGCLSGNLVWKLSIVFVSRITRQSLPQSMERVSMIN